MLIVVFSSTQATSDSGNVKVREAVAIASSMSAPAFSASSVADTKPLSSIQVSTIEEVLSMRECVHAGSGEN